MFGGEKEKGGDKEHFHLLLCYVPFGGGCWCCGGMNAETESEKESKRDKSGGGRREVRGDKERAE